MSSVTDQQPWTIKRLLDWTTDFFQSKQLDSPRLCAEILLAEALQCHRIELYTRFDQIPEEPSLGLYRDWVKRHAKGEPVAYLVGHKEFYSLKFSVDSNVLIPRPETEHLVLAAIEAAKTIQNRPASIVEIGTGSGCVAIALAKHIPQCEISASDISAAAIEVAKCNAEHHQMGGKIQFVESDLFDSIPIKTPFDIIVSNPPYVGTSELASVDESVQKFEPEIALYAGDDGTNIIGKLVNQSIDRLAAGGFLIFETSPMNFDRCLEIVDATGAYTASHTIKDLAGHRRILQTQKRA